MLHTKFRFIWSSGFTGKDLFRYRPIRNKNCLWWTCLQSDQNEMKNRYRGSSIDASYRGTDFLEIHQSEARIACGNHV